MTAVAPPLFGGPVPAIEPGMVPGNPDESSLIPTDMHPPVDLAEDLERFNGKLATYLKPEEITRVGAASGGVTVVKAQVKVGGRGKAGGVKVAKTADEAQEHASAILGMDIKGHTVNQVIIAQGARIDHGRPTPVQ